MAQAEGQEGVTPDTRATGVAGCTIVARNFIAYARALAGSFRASHAAHSFVVLVIDDEALELDPDREDFQLLRPTDIGLTAHELHRLAMMYETVELATALKPRLLKHILQQGADVVIYLDPDIELFASLDDAVALADEHGIVLTPHRLAPSPLPQGDAHEFFILLTGQFNLGFIAVSDRARPMLDWWNSRLDYHCVTSYHHGLFVDQRWLDFVPSFFPYVVWRDPGCNVAYWNLSERRPTQGERGINVVGGPLRFFHFSGFDPLQPDLLSRHLAPSARTTLRDWPAVTALCAGYAAKLMQLGHGEASSIAYGFARAATGAEIEPWMRWAYRTELVASRVIHVEPELPDPFDRREAARFEHWLTTAACPGELPLYMKIAYDRRPDVQAAFPDVTGGDRPGFFEWVRASAPREVEVWEYLLDEMGL